MATFLDLCRKMARDSGTISGIQPVSTVGQTGRLLKVVEWVREAWVRIQNDRENWRWMRTEFAADTIPGVAAYSPAAWNIPNLSAWMQDQTAIGYLPTTLYRAADGVADEGEILFVPYERWRARDGRGSQAQNRPTEYSIGPAGEFLLGAIPDDTYTVRGEYYRAPQVFALDADTPVGLPLRFHEIISWRALMLLAEHDEAPAGLATATMNYMDLLRQLERDQLPKPTIGGGPLA